MALNWVWIGFFVSAFVTAVWRWWGGEAAIFQSFPETYRFTREGENVVIKTVGRLIGNAVPPRLGEAVAKALYASLPTAAGAATVDG